MSFLTSRKPLPLVSPGGMQPYQGGTPQPPGAALEAMLRGTTYSGWNPADLTRAVQKQARRGPQRSLLESLLR